MPNSKERQKERKKERKNFGIHLRVDNYSLGQ